MFPTEADILLKHGWYNTSSTSFLLKKGRIYFGHSTAINKGSKLGNDLPELLTERDCYIAIRGSFTEKCELLCKSPKPEVVIAVLRLQGLV